MIDEKIRPNCRARVNADPRRRVGDLVDEAREQGYAELMQSMRQTMMRYGPDTRIAKQDFRDVLRGWVARERSLDVAHQQRPDGG